MKRTALVFLSIFFAIIINVNAQSSLSDGEKAIKNKDYAKALTIAKEFIDSNNTSDAVKLLIQLEQKNLTDKKLFEYFGDAYSKMNVTENAINYYAKAETIDSLDVSLKFKAAELLYKAERYKEAVNKYLRIAQIDPNNAKAFLQGATILYKAKLYADAAVMFEKYLALDQTKDAFEKISKAFIEAKNYEKCYNYSVDGLKKFPQSNILIKNAAVSSFTLANIELKNHIDSLKNIQSDKPAVQNGKMPEKAAKKYADAAKYYSMLPDSLLTVNDLKSAGVAFQRINDDVNMIKYYEKVVLKDSTQSGLFMDMASKYFRDKNYELAIKFYQGKIKNDPNYEPAHRYLGFAYFGWEKWDEARQSFLNAKKLLDTTFTTNYWLAQTYTKMDSTEQAADQFVKILKLAEGKESKYKEEILIASNFLGQRAFKKGNFSNAITYISKANQLKPGDWRYMEMLGVCYHQLENFDEAIKWYKLTLKSNPKSEVAKKGLRRLSAD